MNNISPEEAKESGLRMKELVDATGIPKSTILFYVEKGLLPQPTKTSPNMAYYPRESVERLLKIKDIQARFGYSLDRIKLLLDKSDAGEDIALYLELDQTIFGDGQGPCLNTEEFCAATGLTPEQLEERLELGILLPLTPGRFDQRDVAMGIQFARGAELGITIEDMEFYVRLGKQIVDHEMALRARLTGHLPEAEDLVTTMDLVRAARNTRAYVLERIFQHRVAQSTGLKDEGLLS